MYLLNSIISVNRLLRMTTRFFAPRVLIVYLSKNIYASSRLESYSTQVRNKNKNYRENNVLKNHYWETY